jgi:ferredoxin
MTILDAALDNSIPLAHNSVGNCACSTCHGIIEDGPENLSAMRKDEDDTLDTAAGRTERSRLACRTRVTGDVTVAILPKPHI